MGNNAAQYPGSVYDGTSPTRSGRGVDRLPDAEDFEQLVAEIIATQQELNGLLAVAGFTAPASLGFYGATPVTQQDITGSTGANAALQNLLTALATIGLITDSTT